MKPIVWLLFFFSLFSLSIATIITHPKARPFKRLSPEENLNLRRTCGLHPMISYDASSLNGNQNDPTFKVMNGRDSGVRSYAVQLMYNRPVGNASQCGGTLISSRHVLTAAHCVFETDVLCDKNLSMDRVWKSHVHYNSKKNWTILLKTRCNAMHTTKKCIENDVPIVAKPAQIITSDNFFKDRCRTGGDIALIELDKDYGPELGVIPACVADPNMNVNENSKLTSFGWGKDALLYYQTYSEHHDVLQEVDLKYEECKKRRDLPKDVICTEEKDKNVCAGDSGGGLMITPISRRHTVIGTVSEGTRCDFMVLKKFEKQPNSGGWFTDVRKYDVFLCEVAGICPIGKRKNKRGLRFGKKQVYDYVVA